MVPDSILACQQALTPPSAPLSRAREGLGVRAWRTAIAMRELVYVSIHREMVTAHSGDHLGN
ncbi:MAG: hypothetical protein ACK6DC_22515 [Planctomycetota bacterium]